MSSLQQVRFKLTGFHDQMSSIINFFNDSFSEQAHRGDSAQLTTQLRPSPI